MSDSTGVSASAIDLIVREEIGSPAYYAARACHPSWPGGASGVSIGVGYDLAYQHASDFRDEWSAHLPAADLERLQAVCGIRGEAARAAAASVADITVPLDAARAVFLATTLPRYVAQTRAAFPGCDAYGPTCVGALASIVYNRGGGMGTEADPPPNYRLEMRLIRRAIATNRPHDVPDLIRSMKRLWPNSQDLRDRRDHEAALFEAGLAG